jgi:hypothetical protein
LGRGNGAQVSKDFRNLGMSTETLKRFLLGVFEAAYGPGVPYLLSFFYLRHEVGFRSGIFLAGRLLKSL